MSTPPDTPSQRLTVGRMMAWIGYTATGIIFVLLFLPAIDTGRPHTRESICLNNMRQVGLAIQGYQNAHGTLPPAYVADTSGRPLYSWRVLILPYADQRSMYDNFHLDEPWNSPHNLQFLTDTPPSFACPAHSPPVSRGGAKLAHTSYFALTSPATAFPGPIPIRPDRIRDGLAKTILLVESSQADVPWTAPVDLDPRTGLLTHLDPPGPPGPISPHEAAIHVVAADGSSRRLDPGKLKKALLPLSTIAGGEVVTIESQ